MGTLGSKEVGRIVYRFLPAFPNGGFTNKLLWLEADQHVKLMFDVHARLMPQHVMNGMLQFVKWVVVVGHPLRSPNDPFNPDDKKNYNMDGGVEFWVGHRFRNKDVGLMAVKNYTIRRNMKYRVLETVRRFGRPYTYLVLTISQDHAQLDSSSICKVIRTIIHVDPSVFSSASQSAEQQSYHFKPSYRKVWMTKQKAIAQIYGNWEESYNKIPRLLQALQECLLTLYTIALFLITTAT
ncbi:hypothetical protein Ahy_A10g049818 [Arachis hypogaea]|uniref:Uncharacterized protein n=1 Tax=Arachis hypogaea TaxID=3818 RepID=A0A445B7Y8_ARAHY|nr:hypothetical protein Ahy_A10g049818 [Arachis hypogaea]